MTPDELAGLDIGPRPAHELTEAQPGLGRRPSPADTVFRSRAREPCPGCWTARRSPIGPPQSCTTDGRVAEVELVDEPLDRAALEVVAVVLESQRLVRSPETEVVGCDRAGDTRRPVGSPFGTGTTTRLAVEEQDGCQRLRRGSACAARPARGSATRSGSRGDPRSARRASDSARSRDDPLDQIRRPHRSRERLEARSPSTSCAPSAPRRRAAGRAR